MINTPVLVEFIDDDELIAKFTMLDDFGNAVNDKPIDIPQNKFIIELISRTL